MRYANALTSDQAKSTSQEALAKASSSPSDVSQVSLITLDKHVSEWLLTYKFCRQAMSTLTSLKGIGPATASAILSLTDPSGNCPFLSDEAMHAFGLVNKAGKLDYTTGNWSKLRESCQNKAEQLDDAQNSAEPTWTAVLVERAIWAEVAQRTADE